MNFMTDFPVPAAAEVPAKSKELRGALETLERLQRQHREGIVVLTAALAHSGNTPRWLNADPPPPPWT